MTKIKYTDDKVTMNISFDKEVFINATIIYKEFGKTKSGFDSWKTRTLIPYAEKLLESKALIGPQIVDLSDLIITKKGKNVGGTWLHPKLAIVFARWISTEFEIWCDIKIAELLSKGTVASSAKERAKWNDLIPSFLAKLSKHGYWSKEFKAIVCSIEDEAISARTHQKFIIQCSERAAKQDRLPMYKKMVSYYKDLMELGSIERRTWEDTTIFLFTQISSVQSRRTNKADKEVTKLLSDNQVLKTKLSMLTEAEAAVPLDVEHLLLLTEKHIESVVTVLKAIDAKILYAGFIPSHEKSGEMTAKGTKYPEYASDTMTFNPFNVAVWINNRSSSYVVVEQMLNTIKFNTNRVGRVHFGANIKNLHVRQYCIFDPTSLATIIFEYKFTI